MSKAAVGSSSSKYVFLNILQYSQKENCVGVSILINLQASPTTLRARDCEIAKFASFFYRTPPVAASEGSASLSFQRNFFDNILRKDAK